VELLYQLFHRVETEGEALELIKSITGWFFFLAALTAFFSLLNPWGLADAALYAGVAFWFRRTHSRAAAVILAILAALLLLNQFVLASEGFISIRGIILRSAMVILSFRGIEAAFKLYRLSGAQAATGVGGARRTSAAGRPSTAVDASADLEILRQLKKAGSDLSKPHLPEFVLDFPNEAAAQEAVAKLKVLGFDAEITPPSPGRQWPVRAQKSMMLTEDALKRTRYHFDRIARAGAGTYEGWGAPAIG
jgi:regulator of ribonuclease activity B